jgi:hypothetical protein
MAITINAIAGNESVAGSRSKINNNFEVIQDEINLLTEVIDTNTFEFDNTGNANGRVRTREVVITNNGATIQQGNLSLTNGNIILTTGSLNILQGSLNIDTGDVNIAGNISIQGKVYKGGTAQEYNSTANINIDSANVFVDAGGYVLTLPDGDATGQDITILHKGINSGTVTITPLNFANATGSNSITLDDGAIVLLRFLNGSWYITGGSGYALV